MKQIRPAVSAQLSVRRGRAAVAFYQAAFGATEVYRVGGTDDDPSVVSQLSVGDTFFWVPMNRRRTPISARNRWAAGPSACCWSCRTRRP